MSAWVFLLLGGMDSIVFGPIRWCVWSFRPSSPLRLPHLKFLFVLFVSIVLKDQWVRHPTTDTAKRSTSKQSTSRRLMGVSKSNTIQSTNQAGCPVRQQQQQTFKVWQPQRAARSKRPNTPSDGSKHNGFQTTNQAVLIPKHVSRQDRAHDQEHHPLLHRLQWHGKQ